MKKRLLIFLTITGFTQHTQILSSSYKNNRHNQSQQQPKKSYAHKNQFAALTEQSDSDSNSEKAYKNNPQAQQAIKSIAAAHQLTTSTKQNNHDSDRDYESDDSDASGIYFCFGPSYYSVHRTSGLIIKTHRIKEAALHKYVNNLKLSHETLQEFKGMILPKNELKDLLEIEIEERPSHEK